MRYAQNGVLVVSRIDLASGQGGRRRLQQRRRPPRTSTVATATPGATWSIAFGSGTASGSLALTIPPVSAVAAVPSASLPATKIATPALAGKPDGLTSLYLLSANVVGAPASVTFATRRKSGTWQRVAVDDSAPYRAFLEPARFAKRARVDAVAVARGANGSVAVSKVVSVDAESLIRP